MQTATTTTTKAVTTITLSSLEVEQAIREYVAERKYKGDSIEVEVDVGREGILGGATVTVTSEKTH